MLITTIRHTTPAGINGICYGRADIPLAESFATEAMGVKCSLGQIEPQAVFSSPATRCLKLAWQLGYQPVIDPRLAEIDMGNWEMQPWENINRKELDAWAKDLLNYRLPGGESFALLLDRLKHFLHEQILRFPECHILLFTHAGIIRALEYLTNGQLVIGNGENETSAGFGSIHTFEAQPHERLFFRLYRYSN